MYHNTFNFFYFSMVHKLQSLTPTTRRMRLQSISTEYRKQQFFFVDEIEVEEEIEAETEIVNEFINQTNTPEREKRIRKLENYYQTNHPEEIGDREEVKVTGRFGRNPLHEAIASRCISEIRKLIEMGDYLYGKDNNGDTPFEMAKLAGDDVVLAIFAEFGITS